MKRMRCAIMLAAGVMGAVLAGVFIPANAAPMPRIAFPQEQSSLAPDADARFGRLPNGFTYIIEKNATPAGTAQIYLRVGVGSMMETEHQKGLAHFLEHMAFNGTTHIPEGELKRTLERHGFAFGADVNAFTTEARTHYTLTVPKTDAETLDTALFIMREIAGEMTIDPEVLDRERGVILSEERVRDTPSLHRFVAYNQKVYAGQKYAGFSNPIGSVDIIKSATRQDLADLYNAWYRPELTTLVIVGDFDPDAIEAAIKAKFSGWQARAPMPEEPDWGQHRPAGLQTFSYTEPGLATGLLLTWIGPRDEQPDSVDREVASSQDAMLTATLTRRLRAMARDPQMAFTDAQLAITNPFRTAHDVNLVILPRPGKSKEAFEQAYGALRSFIDQGMTAQEVQRFAIDAAATKKAISDGYATRGNGAIATTFMAALDSNRVPQGLADRLRLIDTAMTKMTQADLNARLKGLFDGDGPVLAHWGTSLGGFDEAAMKASYLDLNGHAAVVYKDAAIKPWPYTDFGPAAAPVSHAEDKDFGFTRYVFANGVVLNVKPTKLKANEVLVVADFAGGIQSFDPKSGRPFILAQSPFFIGGGLGKLTANEMRDVLNGKTVRADYRLLDRHAMLSGSTTPGDLATEMQLLMAYATDPGLRPDAFDSLKPLMPGNLALRRATPGGVLSENFPHIVLSGDPRYDLTGLAHIQGVTFDDVRPLFTESLKDTPVTVTIVGDVDEALAVAEVGRTFATLPKRPEQARKFPGADHVDFPPAQHEFTLHHTGRADQNISVTLWPTTDFYADTRASRGLNLLSGILRNRLFDELRRKEGADYSPQSRSNQDVDYPGYGYILVQATEKAGGDDDFRATVGRIVTALKTDPISDDELARVRAPIDQSRDNAAKSNAYWLSQIALLGLYPQARRSRLDEAAEYSSVTAADIMALARKYLTDAAAIHIQVLPSAAAKP